MHEPPAVVTRVPRISRPLAVFRRRAAHFEQPFSFVSLVRQDSVYVGEAPYGTPPWAVFEMKSSGTSPGEVRAAPLGARLAVL